MWHSLKDFFEKYEKHISSLMLVGGFIIDNLTLRRIDLFWDDALLVAYLIIAAVSIVAVHIYESGRIKHTFFKVMHPWFLFSMQFVLGGLFSAFFVFYSRSATLVSGWPFLVLLLVYLLGNEFLKKHYARLSARIFAFFMALYSFMIFFIPVILGKMGDTIFIVSGVVSLVTVFVFIVLLLIISPSEVLKSKKILLYGIGGTFCAMNILYFTNIIPPLPLSLKDVGVYSYVAKNTNGTYLLEGGDTTWKGFLGLQKVYKMHLGDPAYVYSAIFAPSRLSTDIVHVWQYYDDVKGEWVDDARINLAIAGGRDGGYRTYSMKESLFPGLWRVNIETGRGQLIGRLKFKVEFVD